MAETVTMTAAPHYPDFETQYAIEKFLCQEARLLDEERFDDWLALFTDDARYVIPILANTFRRNRPGKSSLTPMFIYNDGKADLAQRIQRESTGLVWLNDPPTRHVRVVSNIEVLAGDAPDEYRVHSVVTLYRSRRDRDITSHTARRDDRIRLTGAGYRIATRTVHLLERVILDKNLNTFL
jgi:ethylbenzene dioxygenase beta subunit